MKKKITAICLVVALAAIAVVGATLAYFTDTDKATNTFTVGDVDIELDEPSVKNDESFAENSDDFGKDSENLIKENEKGGYDYWLLPGHEYTKDPTVTVKKNSEESYVRMLVTVSDIAALKAAFPAEDYPNFYNEDLFLVQMLVTGWDSATWEYNSYENGTYEFRYKDTVKKNTADDTELEALFDTVVIPATADADALANLKNIELDIVAEAIQADGFADDDAAFAALEAASDDEGDEPEEEPVLAGVFYEGDVVKYRIDFTTEGDVNGYYCIKDANGSVVKAIVDGTTDNNFVPDENGTEVQAYLNGGNVALAMNNTADGWKFADTLDGLTPTSYEAGAVYEDNVLLYRNTGDKFVDAQGNDVYAKVEGNKLVACEQSDTDAQKVIVANSNGKLAFTIDGGLNFFDDINGLKIVPTAIAG